MHNKSSCRYILTITFFSLFVCGGRALESMANNTVIENGDMKTGKR